MQDLAPSDWAYGGLLAFALVLAVVVLVGSLAVDETPQLQRIFVVAGLAESAAVVVLVLYLVASFTSAYDCG